jgi:tetratricopeptide (TPR) repeat protein
MENSSALSIELDRYTRAEELLRVLLDRGGTVRGYLLMGHLARLMGEFPRAEASYREGLEREPGYADLLYHLADLYLERRMYDRARETAKGLEEVEDSERPAGLLLRIRNATEELIRCASCEREWWVPQNLGPQPAIRLYGEPPGDAPAGKCPSCGRVYCVGCASEHVRDSRFVCPQCDEFLRLSEDSLKYLLDMRVRDAE